MSIDEFLEKALIDKSVHQTDLFANKYGLNNDDLVYYLTRIKEYNNNWLSLFVRTEEGPAIFNFDEIYFSEIMIFLNSGGFKSLESKNLKKEMIDDSNLKYQKNNNKLTFLGVLIALLALITTIVIAIFNRN